MKQELICVITSYSIHYTKLYEPSSYWEKKIKEVSDIYQFDYMICGVHFFDGKFNYGTYKWKEMEFSEVLNMQRKYWQNLRKGIETGIFDFAAHIA